LADEPPIAACRFIPAGLSRAVGSAEMMRVLTVDDHPLLREGIAALFADIDDIQVVAEASNGLEAIEQFRVHRPDITLMDLQMPVMGGIDAMIAIRASFPDARVIVLTTYSGDVLVQRALKAGASAFVLKSEVRKNLIDAIRLVHAGQPHPESGVAWRPTSRSDENRLSPREIRVLQLIALGNSNKHIARELEISEGTVKVHVKSILAKLEVKDRTHAVTTALERGIIGI
jgi:DNA-binding NarL/FixJ family response regulator